VLHVVGPDVVVRRPDTDKRGIPVLHLLVHDRTHDHTGHGRNAVQWRGPNRAVLCRLVEWRPPFSPDDATREAAEVLKEYGLGSVVGDHYAGDWPKDRFKAHGIRYVKADKTKSDYYQALLPLLNGGRVELVDHKRTTGQLVALERSTSRLGKDSISHPPGGHDDLINGAAGALVLVSRPQLLEGYKTTLPGTAKPEQQEGSVAPPNPLAEHFP
jgi:hypothetical protein